MFAWSRRKPELREFAKALNPRRIRRAMKAANETIRPPEGLERTVAARTIPAFGAEIADSQSLESVRNALRAERVRARALKGEKR